jgi:hypothetical protein
MDKKELARFCPECDGVSLHCKACKRCLKCSNKEEKTDYKDLHLCNDCRRKQIDQMIQTAGI